MILKKTIIAGTWLLLQTIATPQLRSSPLNFALFFIFKYKNVNQVVIVAV